MAKGVVAWDTQHEDLIHDAQFDYYGRRLATASSDRTIRIFDVGGDQQTLLAELKGHEGPVWQVSWSHPKFGNLLASCSYDRRVRIWKENTRNEWTCVYTYEDHESSVNSVAWAPHEFGLVLACGSSDGFISILAYTESGTWEKEKFRAHSIGVNAVSWAPAVLPVAPAAAGGAQVAPALTKRLASAGSDNLVRIWRFLEGENKWRAEEKDKLTEHQDWVRDVAWAPSVGLPSSTIASCSQDGTVIIWTQDDPNAGWVSKKLAKPGNEPVWRVSWSVTGNVLAVSGGDNKVHLFKETPEGEWVLLSSLDDTGAIAASS